MSPFVTSDPEVSPAGSRSVLLPQASGAQWEAASRSRGSLSTRRLAPAWPGPGAARPPWLRPALSATCLHHRRRGTVPATDAPKNPHQAPLPKASRAPTDSRKSLALHASLSPLRAHSGLHRPRRSPRHPAAPPQRPPAASSPALQERLRPCSLQPTGADAGIMSTAPRITHQTDTRGTQNKHLTPTRHTSHTHNQRTLPTLHNRGAQYTFTHNQAPTPARCVSQRDTFHSSTLLS